MNVQLKVGNDALFAEYLTKTNMAPYYQTRGIIWDHNQFLNSWQELDNYEVHLDNTRVGVLRFSYADGITFLRDLQLLPEYQGKGIGAKCLDLAAVHALNIQSTKLVLRVFSENPAINLYQSKGFIRSSEVNGLVEMTFPLGVNKQHDCG
ncbi:GNAT family N-acetyltransferase [Vibrio neptunius]|uniref:GNAT family N-acetyltransferase n=1 Tax=Vibrio neptunius TaxID=170651 RepID=A0ABS3A2C2_9VIBR|nr:GNAT family N-acetyltransferase [Vibrio neptunius]MBN3493834.1 GNAT family N-acetyltransferase [Vibrio neptunius]MBN3516343.1 GNAT family N-acetyltransferase [Vibrio neptunius]MBN3550504.1 GNAT family N-acetyltransferase [Vibrio neptunius]MBN3578635.1 GNAT family N-acetyltransferase [Vibrio neptunius]MCH9872300.1 GNAT family N-acetyltransferase [Vibrio neptunius]